MKPITYIIITILFLITTSVLYLLIIPNGTEYISSKRLDARNPSIVLNSSDVPFITWSQGDPKEIVCIKKEGKDWTNTSGEKVTKRNVVVSDNPDTESFEPQITIDLEGIPHIWWVDEKSNLMYAKWNGVKWVNNIGIKPKYNSREFQPFDLKLRTASMIINNEDKTHLLFNNNAIHYAKRDGAGWVNVKDETFSTTNVNTSIINYGEKVSDARIAIDSKGYPNISWKEKIKDEDSAINFIRWNGQNWETINRETYDPKSFNSRITTIWRHQASYAMSLDSKDYPQIAWNDTIGKDRDLLVLNYIKWDGNNWVHANSEKFDPENLKHIYEEDLNWWHQSYNLRMIIGSDDNPHIVYNCYLKNDELEPIPYICYMKWNGTGWMTADQKAFDGYNSKNSNIQNKNRIGSIDFSLDMKGFPHIVWSSEIDRDAGAIKHRIKYIKWDGENWVTADGKRY